MPVNHGSGLEANLQSQASSPAQEESESSEPEGADREQPIGANNNELANEQASQWLKTVLPGATSGWWDVYPKGRGFAVKFCWRDPDRQTLTFPRISDHELQALKQSAPDDAGRFMRDQIFASLRRFLIDPDKRDKAMLVAQKLGIAPDDLQ